MKRPVRYLKLYQTRMGWFWIATYVAGVYLLWPGNTVPFALYMLFILWLIYNWNWDL